MENADVESLGSARKVVANKENTTIVEGKGEAKEIENRISTIRRELADSTSDFDKEKLQERLAKLSGGVAVIKVGAATETEMKQKKYKIEDALNATKAAVEEGIIPGGGSALIKVAYNLESFNKEEVVEGEQVGFKIVKKALEEPLRQIAKNAGILDIAKILEDIKDIKNATIGYDFAKNELTDMIQAGIIDPLKVTRSALENAVSVASTLLTTEAVVTDKPEEKKDEMLGGHNHGMGMDMM